jgi:hypothetical protein
MRWRFHTVVPASVKWEPALPLGLGAGNRAWDNRYVWRRHPSLCGACSGHRLDRSCPRSTHMVRIQPPRAYQRLVRVPKLGVLLNELEPPVRETCLPENARLARIQYRSVSQTGSRVKRGRRLGSVRDVKAAKRILRGGGRSTMELTMQHTDEHLRAAGQRRGVGTGLPFWTDCSRPYFRANREAQCCHR